MGSPFTSYVSPKGITRLFADNTKLNGNVGYPWLPGETYEVNGDPINQEVFDGMQDAHFAHHIINRSQGIDGVRMSDDYLQNDIGFTIFDKDFSAAEVEALYASNNAFQIRSLINYGLGIMAFSSKEEEASFLARFNSRIDAIKALPIYQNDTFKNQVLLLEQHVMMVLNA